ncbi:DUF1254 domain-containing protein [Hansschlegelia sp. KR7-227]|jgi:uncharacterized membrane protein|uniref:DUF1254 domain-containing protein n=1 Tax=Hansschlegelia sp. KR7-227 TaxID=3400914 RepID=UPI003C01CC93
MMRLLYALAVGLTLAGLVHIGSLLGVPYLARQGPYDRLAALGAEGRFVALPDEGENAGLLPFSDPHFVVAACRYDVGDGPVTVRAALPSTYGALSVHNRLGQPYYALTDRAATDGEVEVTILNADDVAAAELEPPVEGRPTLRIVSPTPAGFVLLRLFAPGPSARDALRRIAAGSTCGRAATRQIEP